MKKEIKYLIKKWNKNPYEINNGFCSEFADEIEKMVSGAVAQETHPNSKFFGHVWIEYKGKYYDAEAPDGVSKVEELPIFKKYPKELKYDRA